MSRSKRHTPVFPITNSDSDKQFKRLENRRGRRVSREAVDRGEEAPSPKQFGNPWGSSKDGKFFDPEAGAKDMAK